MPYVDYYKSGSWNFICEVCGQRYKSTEMRKRWDGCIVCPKDFELRHPQDFIKGVRDNPSVPVSRPEAPDTFISFCNIYNSAGIAGIAVAGCAVAANLLPYGWMDYNIPYE